MADNIELPSGSGGATVKTDDDGSAHWQYVKAAFGADNTQTRVTASVGLPVALLAGTAAIGKLAANSGVDIGDVDVTSIVPGVAATSLGKAEDAVHASGDTGVMVLAVRNDTLAALAGTDGDYAPVQVDASGAVYVQEGSALDVSAATVTVDGSGVTQPVSGTVTANLSATDNAVLDQIEVNTSYGDQTGGGVEASALRVTIASDSTGVVTVDNAGTFAVQSTLQAGTAAIGKLAANSGVDIGDVDVTSIVPGTGAANLGKAVDGVAGGTDTGVAPLAVRDDSLSALTPAEGDYVPLRVNSTGALHVTGGGGGTEYTEDVATADPIVGTATLVERDDALTAVTPAEGDWIGLRGSAEGALWVQDFNSDAILADTAAMDTNLGTIAGAVAGTEMQTDVVTQPARAATADNAGAALMTDVLHNGTTALTPKFAKIDAAGSGDNTLVAAVAGKKIRVLSAFLVAAGTVNTRFEDGAAGTALTGQMNLIANSGFTLPFNPLGWFESTANTLLNLELSTAVSVDGCLVYVEV